MKYLLVILLFSSACFGQECEHASGIERFDDVRITFPAKVITFDGKTVNFVLEDRKEVRAGTIDITPSAYLPENFLKNFKEGRYVIIFCVKHTHVYEIQPYKPKKK